MITKIAQKIKDLLKDPSRSFKERVFILLTLVTDLFILLALIGDIILGENIVEIIALIIIVVGIPIVTLLAVKRNHMSIAVRLIVLGMVFVALPIVYFSGGGIYGGGIQWMIFTFLYTGLVLSGFWKPLMLVVLTVESVILYAVGYFFPERVVEHTREAFFADSLISMVLVGIICCFMVWFEEWLLNEENKRAKEETRKVEELNRSQNRFFSNMSHEIRTPINSILGLNEIILRQEDASEEIINDAKNIQGAGKMLLSLINDILDMSKIEAGKMDIVPVNYNLGDTISEIVSMISLRAQQKSLKLNLEVDPTIPAELFGDEVRIKQILVNLLNNAVKYTQEGSVTLRIEKGEDTPKDEVLLLFSVIDTGMGIKQDVIPYLFDAFARMDEEKNAKIEGTGLGLSIVKQLVELMDGKITVNSTYTEGSTFIVALKQKVTRRDPIGDISIQSFGRRDAGGRYMPGFKAPEARVLIVDDNEMNLEVEKKLLDGTDIVVDTVMSGFEAMIMTAKEAYDIIFMDHLMPEMDGIECLQNIRKQLGGRNNHTTVIALTANADSESKELYDRSGFDGYLVKPISGDQLERMILNHLPEAKIIRTEGPDISNAKMYSSRDYSKKMPIIIATSSMCDLPRKVLWGYQIDVIPFSIMSDGMAFYDYDEASADEVMRYVAEGATFTSSPPTVEEFERFFAKEVKKAHQIIYITVSAGISEEYNNAREAARAYGNVTVLDSGVNSGAIGMLVLIAYKMTLQGRQVDRIISDLEKIKKDLRCSFVTGDAEFLMRRGGMKKSTFGFVNTFGLRPVINIKGGKVTIARIFTGELDECYMKYLDFALPRNANPDLDVAIVDYITLTEEERDTIEKAIRNKFNFEHILFQKVSSVMSFNCGRGAMGIMYLKKGEQPYGLSQVLSNVLTGVPESMAEQELIEESGEKETEEISREWYEEIPGIDPVKAIENSGSEDAFRSVLKIFYESIELKAEEIKGLYLEENWKDYTIKVHALKSSARLVGAMILGDAAEKLEMAGKEDNIEYIRKHNDELLKDLDKYKERLAPYFAEEIKDEPSYDDILLQSAYDTLRKAAEEKDDRMIGMTLNDLAEFEIPKKHLDRVSRIKECFERQDYDGIKKECNEE
ncbi:DegV family protein [Butyrivibrio sp. FCS006]|uniref:DegV family protein n=1 Tax=Butyrivibrio sp. FCS006 TaxID=1280684 RepID=UPI000409AF19|nr:DegV family protein [Butyrivibrio sp. FCS006]